ncbi:MAG: aminomethyltransferase family protein, partial [Acidimicrobiia bacterium]|nr:aminomethyltransferase family protein [Acidimicrobiia bacterium]
GPDSAELLERLYPTRIAGIKQGRSKYVLILDERGYVLDDGLVCRDGEYEWFLTFTSSGATFAEMWVRDWSESWDLDVRILNRTMSLGAINVTGPHAKELLERVGLSDPPSYMGHASAQIAGIDCRVFRLSFTGELSFELHHAIADSVELWRALLDAGADLDLRPHGIDALLKLRLEKGHILVGQDSDFDSTPRRLHHEWAVDLSKEFFVGKAATIRTNKAPLNKQLVGLTMDGPAPHEGAVIWSDGDYNGYVTSSTWSPVTEQSVLLGWLHLRNGELPTEATIEERRAIVSPVPFYDPDGGRARA